MTSKESAVVAARQIAAGERSVPEWKPLKRLIAELKGRFEFRLARKVLERALENDWSRTQSVWYMQQIALCTYKDEELLAATRFDEALATLEKVGLRDPDGVDPNEVAPETLPETLALGGAVYKRKWEHGGQMENLHEALAFYLGAWERDPELDMGYGGVNAAFVLDVLAWRTRVLALRCGSVPREADRLASRARALREEMKQAIPQHAADKEATGQYPGIRGEYWYLVTMAEIEFGLGHYAEAGEMLAMAASAPAPEWEQETTWERQTTCRQLVTLARVQGIPLLGHEAEEPRSREALAALQRFLGDDTESALSCYRGRVGLALSGGGFRASLYHLGVLARLAETKVLPSVEVLSTVSGGSIVGAHYYLEVAHLLRQNKDRDIGPEDYARIVERMIEQFVDGVQENLRTRALTNLFDNLKMVFLKSYSRSHRMGELYESRLYSRVEDDHPKGQPRTMSELLIEPADSEDGDSPFKPKFSNWKRRAKVPVLLLNTTSLNSGRSWHFTARWMGEPPGLVGQEIDVNERYRRLWYHQAPLAQHRNYRLGWAVAASACVPGLFEPLALPGLYPGRTVRLVDGGVHDNQGVAGLLNEGCDLLLCSDASGQMADVRRPSDGLLGVPLRANSILMNRVREVEYQDLRARVDSRSVQGLMFIHLKKGLEVLPLDWIGCDDPTELPRAYEQTTDYGIDKDVQRMLSAIRTDLDSFTDVEAYALMLSGYLMTERELKALDDEHRADKEPGSWGSFDVDAPRGDWKFLRLEELMRRPPDSPDARRAELGRQLAAGAASAFKIWKLSPVLKGTALTLAAAVLVTAGWLLRAYWNTTVELPGFSAPFNGLVIGAVLVLAGILVPILEWLRPQEAVRDYATKLAIACFGWAITNLHVRTFDRLYLQYGRLKRLLKLQ